MSTENKLKIPIYASSQISTTLDEFSKSKLYQVSFTPFELEFF